MCHKIRRDGILKSFWFLDATKQGLNQTIQCQTATGRRTRLLALQRKFGMSYESSFTDAIAVQESKLNVNSTNMRLCIDDHVLKDLVTTVYSTNMRLCIENYSTSFPFGPSPSCRSYVVYAINTSSYKLHLPHRCVWVKNPSTTLAVVVAVHYIATVFTSTECSLRIIPLQKKKTLYVFTGLAEPHL